MDDRRGVVVSERDSQIGHALVLSLDEESLRLLASRLQPYLHQEDRPAERVWLSTAEAAEHLGITVHALHKHTSARTVPFEQTVPGAKCWFDRAELDAWRRSQGRFASRRQRTDGR